MSLVMLSFCYNKILRLPNHRQNICMWHTSYRIVYVRPAKFTTSPMCLSGLYEHWIFGLSIWFYRFRLARAIAVPLHNPSFTLVTVIDEANIATNLLLSTTEHFHSQTRELNFALFPLRYWIAVTHVSPSFQTQNFSRSLSVCLARCRWLCGEFMTWIYINDIYGKWIGAMMALAVVASHHKSVIHNPYVFTWFFSINFGESFAVWTVERWRCGGSGVWTFGARKYI